VSNTELKYLIPYLPDILINTADCDINNTENRIINGTLLFADLSGFTAMSEKLAIMGRLGAEKLAGIMNNCFNPLLGLVFATDGDVVKFGGDAFLALFTGKDNGLKAFNCANNLINWVNENSRISTSAGDFTLGIHAGISKGDIFNFTIGSKRRDHLFCGQIVENVYAAADAAELGQLAMTKEAARFFNNLDFNETDDGFYICQNLSKTCNYKPAIRSIAEKTAAKLCLEKFIITGLQDQLHFNNGIIEGEHRVLTNLFIGVNSLRKNLEANIDESISVIDEYFTILNDIIIKYGGAFARLDSSGTSEKMLIFFGAPVCSGRDAQNCLKAVLEIESAMQDINKKFAYPIKHRYGINTGLCFVGDVGGQWRREYTAMGDAINLAARLMSKADYGEALVGEETIKICGNDFITCDGGHVKVKGKQKPVKVYFLEKEFIKESSTELIIGREKELEQVRLFIEKIANDKRAFLLVSGEPGAGKSLLCGRIKNISIEKGLLNIESACFKHTEKTPYVPLKALLSGLLKLSSKSSQKQKRAALQQQIRNIGESEWEPLIAPLLDYFPAVPPEIKNLPDDIKKQKINDILSRLICEINSKNRSLLIIDDIQWIDETSFNIIKALKGLNNSPGIVFISRPGKIYDELTKSSDVTNINLGGLTSENSRKLFLTILEGILPSEDIIQQVIEKSGGNPFYLEEMARAFIELGSERFNAADNIPSGIESVITARIDNLGEMVKKTVRTASVIGRVFPYNALKNIFPDRKRVGKLREYIENLAHLDLTPLERQQPVLEYIFKHILTQEVAYNGLPFSSRKSLHIKTAEFYISKKRFLKRKPDVPAHHYLLAGEELKALPYLFMAGQKAVSEFASSEAFGFFNRVIEISEKHNNKEYLAKALQNSGELAKHTGNYKLAEENYSRLKMCMAGNITMTALALREISLIHRLTADYDKAEIIIDELGKLLPDDIPIKIFNLNGKAEIARRRGKLQDCRELLLKALKLCRENDPPPNLEAVVYNNLGICHWSMGKIKEAAVYYKSALALYRRLKDLNGQSKIVNNLGIISDEMGKLHQAANSYEKAEKIFIRIGASRSEAFACANLGTNFSTRGYLLKAADKLNRAHTIFKKIGDQHSLAYTIGDLGIVYLREGDIGKAKNYLADALEMALQLKDEEFILESKVRLARLRLNEAKLTISEVEKLIDKAKEVGSAELEIKSHILKGLLQLSTGNYDIINGTIEMLNNMEEIRNYPELELELSKLKILFHYIFNDKTIAIKLLNTAFKKAISGDLAIMVSDLIVVGNGCGLMLEIPSNISGKISQYFERLKNNMESAKHEQLMVFIKRKTEYLKSMLANCQDKQNQSKVLDFTNK